MNIEPAKIAALFCFFLLVPSYVAVGIGVNEAEGDGVNVGAGVGVGVITPGGIGQLSESGKTHFVGGLSKYDMIEIG